jgi:hypothetical protein
MVNKMAKQQKVNSPAREKILEIIQVAMLGGPGHLISGVSSNRPEMELASRLGYISGLRRAIDIIDELGGENEDNEE